MTIRKYIPLLLVSMFAGALLFCIMQELIIIHMPARVSDIRTNHCVQRSILLYRWQEHTWHTSTTNIVGYQNAQEMLTLVVAAWLSMAYEEQLVSYHVSLQSALLSMHEDVAYLSFSDRIVQHNKSTIDNLWLIESLLRTIHVNIDHIQACLFLVNHAPMQDYHLDFTQPWPIAGFMPSTHE